MVQELINFLMEHNVIAVIFYKILYMSIIGSFVGILILVIRRIFDKKITPKWKCIIWGVFIASLLIPFRFEIKTDFLPENKLINSIGTIQQVVNVEKNIEEDEANGEILNSALLVSDLINKEIDSSSEVNLLVNQKQYTIKDILLQIVIPYSWFLIVIVFLLFFILGYRNISKKVKNNKCDDVIVNNILKNCLEELNIKSNIKVYYQNYKKVTSIFGIFNSKILISKETLKLEDEELKYVFLHELAHYKRKDLILNMIMLLMLSIHFFNPIVWYLFKRIREDIELAADEYVIRNMSKNEIKQYGLTLIRMLELNQTNDYAINFLCMSDTERNMERRIKMIKNPFKNKLVNVIFVILIIVILTSIVFVKSSGKENMLLPVENNISMLNQNYEHLWTEPKETTSYEEYQELTGFTGGQDTKVTDEEMTKLISKEEAIEIAKEILNKVGYTDEKIETTKCEKNCISTAKYNYEIKTTNGLYVYIDAENGKFEWFIYRNLIKKQFENESLSDNELKILCLNLYNSFDFLDRGYEFYNCKKSITAMGEGDPNSPDYKQYTKEEYTATFYKKQDSGILNKYKAISISFYVVDGTALIEGITHQDEVKSKEMYYSNIEYISEDNEVEISEEIAIQIAKEKDAFISNNKIKYVRTELITNMTNYDVWTWENGYERNELYKTVDLDNNTQTSYPKYYYDKYYVRNTYEVVIYYECEGNQPDLWNGDLGRVYYIDATTGEILGGRIISAVTDIDIENDYLFDEEDNYTCYKTTYYDSKTREKIYEYEHELSDEMKSQFYIKKDEKPNTVSYNIY